MAGESSHMLARAPAWVGARPSLRVGWLMWRNALRRGPIAAAGVGVLIALVGLARAGVVERGLAGAAGAPSLVCALTAIVLGTISVRRRRRLARDKHRDWLAALPHDLSPSARAAAAPLAIWGAAVLVVASASIASRLPSAAGATLLFALTGGYLIAIAFVALDALGDARRRPRAGGRGRNPSPPSRYAVIRRPRTRWATHARLTPLGYWPLAHAKFLDRPKVRARSLVLLLLALPLGSSGIGVVALVAAAIWLILLHLANLLIGVVRVAFAASWWLAPTPVGTVRFAAALSYRALIAQIAAWLFLIGTAYAIEGSAVLHTAAARSGGWIAADCVLSVAVCVLARNTASIARSALHRWIG